MSRISEIMRERRCSYTEAKRVAEQEAQGSFAAATGSAVHPGFTLKDLRELVIKYPPLPKLSWVRVSDGWWVKMDDDKPTAFVPHDDLMKAIEEVCRPVGTAKPANPARP